MTPTCTSTYKRRRCSRPTGHPDNHLSGEPIGAYAWHDDDADQPTLDFHTEQP